MRRRDVTATTAAAAARGRPPPGAQIQVIQAGGRRRRHPLSSGDSGSASSFSSDEDDSYAPMAEEARQQPNSISLDDAVSPALFDGEDEGEELRAYRRDRTQKRKRQQYAAPSPFALAQPSPRPPAARGRRTTAAVPSAQQPQQQPQQPQQQQQGRRGLPANAAALPGQPQGGGGGDGGGHAQEPPQQQQNDMDQSVEDEDEDKDSNYLPSITERQKRIRNAFGDIFDNDEGGSSMPCFACEVLRGNIHSVKHSKLVHFMLQITARDRIMTYDVRDYSRIANEYEQQIRQPHNRRLRPGQTPLPPFPATRIYQHINRPHIKNRHLRMEQLVHDMFDLAEEMKDELRVEHVSLRRPDGRPVKRTRKKTLQGFNTLLVQLKHYNSYLDSVPAESRLEALQASALSTAGYGTERLLDNLADHREDLLAEMMGRDGLGNTEESGPARKRQRR